jgi:hypothetical protein
VPYAISPHKFKASDESMKKLNNNMHNHDIALTAVARRGVSQLRTVPDSIKDTLVTMIQGGVRQEVGQLYNIAVRHFYMLEGEHGDELDASLGDASLGDASLGDASLGDASLEAAASNILPFDRMSISKIVKSIVGNEPVDEDLAKLCVLLGKREGLSWNYRDDGAGG